MGTYQVFITEAWPSGLLCSGASPIVSISATPSDKLFIYPSPNDGSFNLAYYYGQSGTTSRQINIYDTKGALVFQQRFTISGAYMLLPIELPSAAAGLYVVVVGDASGNKLTSGKVIVN
jgi:hypothetical protein